ncbi:MAG TPA: hypothetical protein VIK56_12125, partial [Rhodoferax sp.]
GSRRADSAAALVGKSTLLAPPLRRATGGDSDGKRRIFQPRTLIFLARTNTNASDMALFWGGLHTVFDPGHGLVSLCKKLTFGR